MDSFFSYLKHARETSGIPLEEISDQTLINLKMLEALERGEVESLPQAYIRAFIREYAATIGLDPADAMRRYDEWRAPSTESDAPADVPAAKLPVKQTSTESQPTPPGLLSRMPTVVKIAGAILGLILIDIALWNVLEKEPVQPVKELPFRDVVREVEERAAGKDTTVANKRGIAGRAATDSLTLVATTTDSVWMEIVLDDSLRTEHFLYPKTTRQWRAKSHFLLLTIGNPTAISFTLNNKPVGIPVRPGAVTRNVQLDRTSLQ